jgi:uncharacterized membrane protein/protein-disulfide isomerase
MKEIGIKTRVQLALVGCLISVGLHLYLVLHYYPLKLGIAAGDSMCNLSAKLNCDAVSASVYSSFLGIPMALWGAVTNGVLFVLILLGWLEWSDNPERVKRFALLMAFMSFAASVVMGTISVLLLSQYCIVCITLYVFSAIIYFLYRGVLREPFWMHFKLDLPVVFEQSKGLVAAFVAIPLVAYLAHQAFLNNFGDQEIDHMAIEAVALWQTNPLQQFVAKPTLVMGPSSESAVLTLAEFADFRCGHCKHASYSLDAFVKAHPDVRFEFYTFPLDGVCNEAIPNGNGVSCRLAAAVFCAEKESKGWEAHHRIYDMQDQFLRLETVGQTDEILARELPALGVNWQTAQTCMADPTTMDAIKSQAKQGALVDVRGTPTIFGNGRKLERGQIIPVLQLARQKALEQKKP